LNAVAQYRGGEFDKAVDTFLQHDVNPAKVVALFPPVVAGRLSVAPDEWIHLYGGPSTSPSEPALPEEASSMTADATLSKEERTRSDSNERTNTSPRTASPMGTIRETLKTGLEAMIPSALKDDDSASIKSKHRTQTKGQCLLSSVAFLS
jgi:hypothetical protein